jgi:hypothetical protein
LYKTPTSENGTKIVYVPPDGTMDGVVVVDVEGMFDEDNVEEKGFYYRGL